VGGIRDEQGATSGETLVAEGGFLDAVVLEVAARQEDARRVGREVGVFALEPGAADVPTRR